MPKETRVLYLDIDGTVRWGKDELGRFVNGPEDVRVFEEVPHLLVQYIARGWKIIGISNQAGIGLGYMDHATCVSAMIETDKQTGNAFEEIFFCAHKPDEGCACRKPKTALLYKAAIFLSDRYTQDFPFDKAVFVGDRPEDFECASNAGIQFVDAKAWRNGNHLAELLWDEA